MKITVTCSATNVTVAVVPSTVIIKHTGMGQGPTNVPWLFDNASTPSSVTISPGSGGWPFQGTPPFGIARGGQYAGTGKPTQTAGIYHYTLTAACPGGPTITIDPDVIVD